jgi:hypothetical protein
VFTSVRLVVVTVAALGCTALAACGADDGAKQDAPPTAAPVTSAPAKAIDPCTLLTPSDAQAVLHKTLGSGRKVTTGDLNECVYDDSGPLIIAVLKGSFTKDSFQQMIITQENGPYGQTTGKAVAVAGLGDAAYSYDKVYIVEVLKNATVLSITSASTATSTEVARAVLPHLS